MTAYKIPENIPKNLKYTNKDLARLLVPLVIEQFLNTTVGLADSLMVAQAGEAAISAVSLVDAISLLMINLFSALATGGAVIAGQYMGRQENSRAQSASLHLQILLLFSSILITVFLYLFRVWILEVLYGSIDADVYAATNTYYLITMASIPAIALYNGAAACFRAIDRSKVTLLVSLLMNAINIVGNAILIFGFHMGVEGVAYPTLVSRYIAAAVILGLLCDRRIILNISSWKGFHWSNTILKNILGIGIPNGMEDFMFRMGRLVMISLISTFGRAATVANSIGVSLGNYQVFFGSAICLGVTTVCSKCVGAGEFDLAKAYMRKFSWIIMTGLAVVNIALLAMLPWILSFYNLSDEAYELSTQVLWLHGIASILIWHPGFGIPTFLRAAGDAKFSMIVSILSMWIMRVLCAFIIGKWMGYGVVGVYFAHTVLDWSARSVAYMIRYRSGKWKSKAIRQ